MKSLDNLFSALKDIGLKEKETATYLALLIIGENAASTIAKKAKIQRSTCYQCLRELMKKGFVKQIIKKNISYFSPVEPQYVLQKLQEKRWDIENKIQQLRYYLPEFEKLQHAHQKAPKVYFFEGRENIENLLEDSLNTKEILRLYDPDNHQQFLFEQFPKYAQKIVKRGIVIKLLLHNLNKPEKNSAAKIKKTYQAKLIPPNYYNYYLPMNILLYDEKFSLISIQENLGISIESKEMVEALKKIFDDIWKSLK